MFGKLAAPGVAVPDEVIDIGAPSRGEPPASVAEAPSSTARVRIGEPNVDMSNSAR